MKRAGWLGCLIIAGVATVGAETSIDITGNVRVRTELDKRSFLSNAIVRDYTDLRTRLTVSASRDENAKAVIQFQDSRRLGGQNGTGADLSGTLNNGLNVDVHQAYLWVNHLWSGGLGLQAGRFEVNLGSQRVFGAVGWQNVGRSWEGLHTWWSGKSVAVHGYWLKRRELNSPTENNDFTIVGGNLAAPEIGLQVFVFLENDNNRFVAGEITPVDALNRVSAGLYAKRTFGAVDIEANGVYQFGTQRIVDPQAIPLMAGEQDIAAFLATFEIGVTVAPEAKARLAAAVDFASGDDDPTDNEFSAYNNLYYTGHKFRGFMDYFLASNPEGLIDLILRGSVAPAPKWMLKTDLHLFQTVEDYTVSGSTETSTSVGTEIDITLVTTSIPGFTWQTGFSAFLPSEDFAGPDADPGIWVYLMGIVSFGG